MELAHPDRLLFLAALPVLFLIAVLRRPAPEIATAHLTVWDQVLRRRSPRRRRWLRFLLFALAFACVTAAAADPVWDRKEGPSRAVLLFDVSASTGAAGSGGESGDVRERVFDRLRRRVVDEASRWPADSQWRVALIGRRAQVLEMRAGEVERVLPTDPLSEPNEVEVGTLFQSVAALPDTLVWSLGDASSPSSSSIRTTRYSGVGGTNRAIVEASVLDRWPLDDVEVRLALRGVEAGASFQLLGGARLVEVQPWAGEEAGESSGEIRRFRALLRRTEGGEVVLGLADRDLLPADDQIRFTLPRPIAPRIAIAATDRFGELVGRFLAERTGGSIVEVAQTERADCLVTDGGSLAATPARGLTFGTWIGERPAEIPKADPRLVDWNRAHPLTAGLDLSELRVRRTLPTASLPSVGRIEVLLRGPDGPLMVVRERGAERSIHAAFRLGDSNLWALPAFPRLLERALRFVLRGERVEPEIEVEGLLDLRESREAERRATELDAELPAPAAPGIRLTPWLGLLAALILGLRALT